MHGARVVAEQGRVRLRLAPEPIEGEVEAAVFPVNLERRYFFMLAPHPRRKAVAHSAVGKADAHARQVFDVYAKRRPVWLATFPPGGAGHRVDGRDWADQRPQQIEKVGHHVFDDAAARLVLLVEPGRSVEHGARHHVAEQHVGTEDAPEQSLLDQPAGAARARVEAHVLNHAVLDAGRFSCVKQPHSRVELDRQGFLGEHVFGRGDGAHQRLVVQVIRQTVVDHRHVLCIDQFVELSTDALHPIALRDRSGSLSIPAVQSRDDRYRTVVHDEAALTQARKCGQVSFAQAARPEHRDDEGIGTHQVLSRVYGAVLDRPVVLF